MTLKSKKERETDISSTNHEGLPCYSCDSEEIRDEHDKWRAALRNRQGRKVEEWRYWKQVSNCKAL